MSRYVTAPTVSTESGSVLGVFLNLNERVEWVYTVMPDGRRIVTGYDILAILPYNSELQILLPISNRSPPRNRYRLLGVLPVSATRGKVTRL